ncbi:Putative lipooligosaccharide biosynthesis protein [Actinobacillus ureae]|uniref:glycosyltransferase family 2 protein n=1 Tax=Actinobacillus ureae TaxID=723 RepID=UPI000E1378FB|nr:glycosyltransferase family A protein [Actinobacillus ureae]SUT87614.1 Putative lipooligosaccharide biosynthesis protein [Actinobacillus ureae]SUU49161.1 Putative lipooligosaccharide biosynthesis protein [Actinobacillus ureae]
MIDVIIPCYNAEQTLVRAVQSALNQPELGTLWLVDDASTDNTLALAQHLQSQVPHKISVERMPENGGVAKARNWGALQSEADFIAFLDADDAYEDHALQIAEGIFTFRPEISVVRLALKPIDMPERYSNHPNFEYAWQHMRMTCGGNTIFRRSFFLACGGFPQHQLFRELGGEDGTLGIATTQISAVATAFNDAGVLHYCRDGMHAERLLDAILFNKTSPGVTAEKMAEAQAVTDKICEQITQLKTCLETKRLGIKPLNTQWN